MLWFSSYQVNHDLDTTWPKLNSNSTQFDTELNSIFQKLTQIQA